MTQKTILLTGATGYLGSELLKYWSRKGHKIVILKRTTSSLARVNEVIHQCKCYDVDLPGWENVFKHNNIDVIVHLATTYGKNGEDPNEIVNTNTLFPLKLLDNAIKNGVKVFINTGSSLPKDINPYALSKFHFKDWMLFRKHEIHTINLCLEYFYGFGDDNWKFITMVINKLLGSAKTIEFSSGNQKRDFIHISDVISAYDKVLNNFNKITSGQTVSVGSGESYTIREVVEMCKFVCGNGSTNLNFGAIADRPGEVPELIADTSQLKEIGWKKKYTLKSGLRDYIKKLNNSL